MRSRDRGAVCVVAASVLLIACNAAVGEDALLLGARADADAAAGEARAWTPLLMEDWSLAPGGEETKSGHTIELDRDIYVGAIRPITSPGTHHVALGLTSSDGSTGVIYGSAAGANEVMFPEGVGLKFPSGSTLGLQFHVYNTTAEPLSGSLGVEALEVAPEHVVEEADLVLLGPFVFTLPAGKESTVTSTCTVLRAQTIFALFPHMHRLGTHFETTLTIGGEQSVLHDAPYDFDEQAFHSFDPIQLSPGDQITTRCTWRNSLDVAVLWGESSDAEMCFSVLYRFPAGDDDLCAS